MHKDLKPGSAYLRKIAVEQKKKKPAPLSLEAALKLAIKRLEGSDKYHVVVDLHYPNYSLGDALHAALKKNKSRVASLEHGVEVVANSIALVMLDRKMLAHPLARGLREVESTLRALLLP